MLTIKRSSLWGGALALLSLSLAFSQAQNAALCPDIVNQALNSLGDNCTGVGRNEACYGYDLVAAQFNVDVPEDFFSQPSDRASILDMAKIQTAQLSVDSQQWGIGLLSLQANVPNSLPGQAVTFVLIGAVEVENAVEEGDAFMPAQPIDVSSDAELGVRSAPDTRSNIIASLPAGQAAPADGLSADGLWVRVTVGNRAGWVERAALAEADLSSLPALDGTQRMPMQAFYLRTGIGRPECTEATNDVLLVQGPKSFKVDLTVNGAAMEVGSTVLYRIIDEGNTMEIIVIDGEVRVKGGGENGEDVVITTGQRSQVCLDTPDDRGVDGEANDREVSCPFSEPETIPPGLLGQQWCLLEDVSPDVLNYPIDLACETVVEALSSPTATPQPPPPRPLIPVTEEVGELAPTATASYIQNLCDPGGPWDDGRCNSDDPTVRDWYYNAGWYFAQADAGLINRQDIPAQYNLPTLTPVPPEGTEEDGGFNIFFYCSPAGFTYLKWNNLPGGSSLDVDDWLFDDGTYSYTLTGTGAKGLSAPNGTLGPKCLSGTYDTDFSVTGTLNTSGNINGSCICP